MLYSAAAKMTTPFRFHLAWGLFGSLAYAGSYHYTRIGNKEDVQTKTTAGVAMFGGGSDPDEAFHRLCEKGRGGDILMLRATGDDDYNSYVSGLCQLNSVATLIIPTREAAQGPAVGDVIRKAELVFISGGDQANYIRGWQGTPIEDTINADIATDKPIGGTSVGLAVSGQYMYSAQDDAPDESDLTSRQVLTNPYFTRVTLRRDFLKIDLLRNILTDTHFAQRDRMGRTLNTRGEERSREVLPTGVLNALRGH